MSKTGLDFENSWLWRHAFVESRLDASASEQEYFRNQFLSIRERAAQLVAQIPVNLPGMTVHDISHLDALWEMASIAAEGVLSINPPEAFVFGVSVLLHDAAMSVAAYPGGLDEIRRSTEWKDAAARLALRKKNEDPTSSGTLNSTEDSRVLSEVLRKLHAVQAERLAQAPWTTPEGDQLHIIQKTGVRVHFRLRVAFVRKRTLSPGSHSRGVSAVCLPKGARPISF